MRKISVTVVACLALLGVAQTSKAVPVLAGVWYEFSFGEEGSLAAACTTCEPSSGTPTTYAGDPAWTYTAPPLGAFLLVTDAFRIGDAFLVFDFGTGLGATNAWTGTFGDSCGNDPVPCLGVASSGAFFLPQGPHSLDFVAGLSPFGGGAAYFNIAEVETPIPEPTTVALLGLGLVGLRRFRRR